MQIFYDIGVLRVLFVHAKVAKYFTQRTQRVDN